jgi:hypothetical protein
MWPIRQDWQLSKHQIDIGGGGNQTGRRLIFADNFFRGVLDRPEKGTVLSAG